MDKDKNMNTSNSETSYNVNSKSRRPGTGATSRHVAGSGTFNHDWRPNQLKLNILRQHSNLSNPMGEKFNYAEEFKSLDLAAVKKYICGLMTTSQDWWPADYGNFGPLFVRKAWRSAIATNQRPAQLNSCRKNANLGKIRMLLRVIASKPLLSNPPTFFFSLAFWGAIWGITGIFLSVPIMVVIVIAFSKMPQFRPIAILISGNGEIVN